DMELGGWTSGPQKAKVTIGVDLKDADGREVWSAELQGSGHGKGVLDTGGAWNAALNDAIPRLGPMLAEERPWERLPHNRPLVASVAAPISADAPPPSDIDTLPPAGPEHPRSYAVVVGVEHYRAKLPNADFAANDARLAAEYFKRVLGVPEANVALLTDDQATKGDFEKYFERWLPNQVQPGDVVYVYYSGHGAPNPAKGDAYLVPYDGDPAYVDQTSFAMNRLYADLAKLPAKQVYVAIDSCFSGAGGRSVLAQGARPLVSVVPSAVPANVTVVSASAGNQISNTYQEKGHGLFTYYLLKGLRETNGDLRAAFDYLKPEVVRQAKTAYNSEQVPQWRQGQ
ncbi:MAG TPA: caspase family protein, partial [Elusimicrobiota bacterium]|nr:caspase family protein [Elusimicrobiota bacterium]